MSEYTKPICRGRYVSALACGKCEWCAGAADDWTPDERTVRLCHEIAKKHTVGCAREIEALLPDLAAGLVHAFDMMVDTEHSADYSLDAQTEATMIKYTRWLIDTGRIKP